jgi:hypothetical protein
MASVPASARPLLHDPVELNIGINCQWQARCMVAQRIAMKRSLAYVAAVRPPHSQVQLCNRNAARGGYRVDWVGYDHCIRNPTIKRQSRRAKRYANR